LGSQVLLLLLEGVCCRLLLLQPAVMRMQEEQQVEVPITDGKHPCESLLGQQLMR
jgi:hypothetical protein